MPWYDDPLQVERKGELTDAWGKSGIYVKYVLDTPGGKRGYVNSPFMSYTVVGPKVKNFVYGNLNVLDNQAEEGENCAGYDKAIKNGKGPTWGRCVEVQDKNGHPGAMIGQETDVFSAGPANDPDKGDQDCDGKVRVGLDTLVGDEKFKTDGMRSDAQASIGHRVAASAASPWARWLYGEWLTDYLRTGLTLFGKGAERGIRFLGKHTVGIDFSQGELQSIVRMKEGQAWAFDEYDDVRIRKMGGELQVVHNKLQADGSYVTAIAVRINPNTGVIYARDFVRTP